LAISISCAEALNEIDKTKIKFKARGDTKLLNSLEKMFDKVINPTTDNF